MTFLLPKEQPVCKAERCHSSGKPINLLERRKYLDSSERNIHVDI